MLPFVGANNDHLICVLLPQVPDLFCSTFIRPQVWLFVVLALVGKDVVFRFIIEHSSFKDFGP